MDVPRWLYIWRCWGKPYDNPCFLNMKQAWFYQRLHLKQQYWTLILYLCLKSENVDIYLQFRQMTMIQNQCFSYHRPQSVKSVMSSFYERWPSILLVEEGSHFMTFCNAAFPRLTPWLWAPWLYAHTARHRGGIERYSSFFFQLWARGLRLPGLLYKNCLGTSTS
jgi:hypothetical protein